MNTILKAIMKKIKLNTICIRSWLKECKGFCKELCIKLLNDRENDSRDFCRILQRIVESIDKNLENKDKELTNLVY